MILVDTNVIIDIWNEADEKSAHLFETEEVCICGVIRSELMHGAYSEKNMKEISDKLDYLREFNIESDQWDDFGEFLYRLRTSGVTLPYADALIAFIAIKNDLMVLTKDKHFRLIQDVFPELRLA